MNLIKSPEAFTPSSLTTPERKLFCREIKVVKCLVAASEPSGASAIDVKVDARVGKIVVIALHHAHRALGLEALASSFDLGSRHLGRLFFRDVGLTFHDFLRTIRLASRLLKK